MDAGAAPLEHARCHDCKLLVDLGQDSCAGLEQPEANLVASDPRIEAQHATHECRELTQQLDTDEAAADDDYRETAATCCRFGGRIRSFELLDQVISQHQRIRHRLEREGVR
jgi:hypothetical protein